MKLVRSETVVKLILALLVGTLAALATYELIKSPRFDRNVDRRIDSPGPLF